MSKNDLYPQPEVWRKVEIPEKNITYLIPTDVVNVADHIHVDMHDPGSVGYGGSTLDFRLEDGTVYKVKGPWHTSASGLKSHTNGQIDLTYLHGTMVTIYSTKSATRIHKDFVKNEETGKMEWRDRDFEYAEKDEIIYQETTPVLGPFMRGDNIAHAYADATGRPVHKRTESYGGASEQTIYPYASKHPMAKRNE